jgi:hypothetical protein
MELNSWDMEVRKDGALLVRVHSTDRSGQRLPDAVFTFRPGDPQYEYWEAQWRKRSMQSASLAANSQPTLAAAHCTRS